MEGRQKRETSKAIDFYVGGGGYRGVEELVDADDPVRGRRRI